MKIKQTQLGGDGAVQIGVVQEKTKRRRPHLISQKPEDLQNRLKELDEREKTIALQKQVRDREIQLGLRREWKKPNWCKAMMVIIIGLCIEIVIYAEWVMAVLDDSSALYVLLGIPGAMFSVFWAYCSKSKAENTAGGITYDTAMQQLRESMAAVETNDDSTGVDADSDGVG